MREGATAVGCLSASACSVLLAITHTLALAATLSHALLLLLLLLLLLQVIGATSSLTYNVVGHVKTVLILSGGVMFFGDTMPPKKMAGIACAMGGIIW